MHKKMFRNQDPNPLLVFTSALLLPVLVALHPGVIIHLGKEGVFQSQSH